MATTYLIRGELEFCHFYIFCILQLGLLQHVGRQVVPVDSKVAASPKVIEMNSNTEIMFSSARITAGTGAERRLQYIGSR